MRWRMLGSGGWLTLLKVWLLCVLFSDKGNQASQVLLYRETVGIEPLIPILITIRGTNLSAGSNQHNTPYWQYNCSLQNQNSLTWLVLRPLGGNDIILIRQTYINKTGSKTASEVDNHNTGHHKHEYSEPGRFKSYL